MQHLDMSIFEEMVGLKNILIAHIYIRYKTIIRYERFGVYLIN